MAKQPVILALFSILAASPIANTKTLSPNAYANIHTVGIVSAIGDCLVLENVAAFVADGALGHLDTRDWGIDDLVTKDVTAAVRDRFEVRPITYRVIPKFKCESDIAGPAIDFGRENDDVDAYIVVHKWWSADFFTPNSSARLVSLGLYRHRGLLLGPIVWLHAFFQIAVVDAHTQKVIDYGSAGLPGRTIFGEVPPPARQLDPAIWPDVTSQFGDEQRQYLRAEVTALVRASLIAALVRANVLSEGTSTPPLDKPGVFRPTASKMTQLNRNSSVAVVPVS